MKTNGIQLTKFGLVLVLIAISSILIYFSFISVSYFSVIPELVDNLLFVNIVSILLFTDFLTHSYFFIH